MRTQAEWKVETHMRWATGPISEPSLSRISAAALLVKVMARIWLGHAPNWLKIQAMRAVSTRAFAGACTGSASQR